jgi:integrase
MAGKYTKTRHKGVFYRESSTRTCSYGPDRCYVVWYTDALGKPHWHTVGWHSDGIRPAFANEVRNGLTGNTDKSDKSGTPEAPQILTPSPSPICTVGMAMARYFQWAEGEGKHVGPERNRYEKHLKAPLDAVPLDGVNLQMLWDIKAALRRNIAKQTVRHCFGLLRRAVNHATEIELWKGENPFAIKRHGAFKLSKADNEATRYLTRTEARALLAALRPRSQQLHDMALLSLKTGMRATEIFSIRGQGLDKSGGVIHFIAKGGAPGIVQAPADILTLLHSYRRAPSEFVFQAENGGPFLHGISETFDRVIEELGYNKGLTDTKCRVRFHTLRHTFASWLAQSGQVTLYELMGLMRHKRIEMTIRYAHLIPGSQRRKLTIIDDALLDPDHDD